MFIIFMKLIALNIIGAKYIHLNFENTTEKIMHILFKVCGIKSNSRLAINNNMTIFL